MSGLHMPFFDYPATNYSGGSLAVGLIGSCFFRLLGPTVFSLKLTPVLFFTLALVFWYLVLQRHVGERVAVYFALTFVFSPPLFTSYSVAALGSHSESIFFTAFSLFLLFQLLSTESPGRVAPSLLGLTAGCGLWFSYSYGLTLLALLLFWFRHDEARLLKIRLAYFTPFFVVGFSPWIAINVQHDFSGLVIAGGKVWEHFSLEHVWKGLTDYRLLMPYQLLANFAAEGEGSLQKRITNLSYDLLFFLPIVAAFVWRPRASSAVPVPAKPAETRVQEFAILYLGLFAIVEQLYAFKVPQYTLPAYPFLFFFLALSMVRLEDRLPQFRNVIRTVFLSSLMTLGIVFHGVLFSPDSVGASLAAKGYSYGFLVEFQLCRDDWRLCDDEKPSRVIPELAGKPFLASILQDIAPEDRQEMSHAIVQLVAAAFPFDQRPGSVTQARRLIPPTFEGEFYYLLGRVAMHRFQPDLAKAMHAVESVRGDTAELHRLALTGILREWPETLPLDTSPESLTKQPMAAPVEMVPEYWRAVGHYAGRYWLEHERSPALLERHLNAFVSRLDRSVRRSVLQGVGRFLFGQWRRTHVYEIPFDPREVERLADEFHQGLFEGAGLALSEFALLSWHSRLDERSTIWNTGTRGLSDRSLTYVRDGRREFFTRLGST